MKAQLTLAAALIGAALSVPAAACELGALHPEALRAQSAAFTQFVSGFRTEAAHGVTPAALTFGANTSRVPHGSIVGFWKFAFTAPDGSTGIDWGFQSWHDDGTEITNSGAQLPATGNFCTGVWQQSVTGTYHLSHWAIAWNLPGTDPSDLAGLINIREAVDVDAGGNAMSGTVSLDLYALDGTTHLAHLADGTVSGTRLTP